MTKDDEREIWGINIFTLFSAVVNEAQTSLNDFHYTTFTSINQFTAFTRSNSKVYLIICTYGVKCTNIIIQTRDINMK